jgi:hypothetical protein
MQVSVARFALLIWLAAFPAHADDLADFNAAVEVVASHQRVALGYLRTGNVDLAAMETDRMRTAWSRVTALKRPAALNRDPQLYTTTMLDISTKLVGISIMMDSGKADVARKSLEGVRAELSTLRKTNGVAVLADCISDANATMEKLARFDDSGADLNKAETRAAISDLAASYHNDLQRCDDIADQNIRGTPEFRRLIDGAKNSLSQFPKTLAERDNDLLHRLFGELRALDNLLAFRYG